MIKKTNEIPAHIWKIRCNFCIECEFNDKMTDYYKEWWDEDEFMRLYFGEPIHHNDAACQALKEYESKAQYRDEYMYEQLTDDKGMKIYGRRLNTKALPLVSMSEIAAKYGVTIDEMKQHWRCVENGG